ncbi:MAG: ABC transporter permease [Gemmatimonadota bacterium]|nr:ABC transporter permease [Gemmatimonadota bacterium]
MAPTTKVLIQREIASSVHGRWFLAYATVFLLSGVLMVTFGMGDAAIHGYRGFARAFAAMTHLALLFVPLMALFPAVASLAEERDRGGLEFLLAQPVTFGEVFFSKWVGVGGAVTLALTLGFGTAGSVALLRGVPFGLVATLYLFVLLLAWVFVSIGFLLSVTTSSRSRATTVGILVWLTLVALGTLGLMIAFIRWGVPRPVLSVWTFANPIEAFRIGIVTLLDPDFSLLGPVGVMLLERLGTIGTALLAGSSLVLWILIPTFVAWKIFAKKL